MAKELTVPIIALSQLSRQVETATTSARSSPTYVSRARSSRMPTWWLFVFREEYYLTNKEPRPGTGRAHQVADRHGGRTRQAEVIIGKQRHGPTGTVNLQFEASVTRFDNLAQDISGPERGPAF